MFEKIDQHALFSTHPFLNISDQIVGEHMKRLMSGWHSSPPLPAPPGSTACLSGPLQTDQCAHLVPAYPRFPASSSAVASWAVATDSPALSSDDQFRFVQRVFPGHGVHDICQPVADLVRGWEMRTGDLLLTSETASAPVAMFPCCVVALLEH